MAANMQHMMMPQGQQQGQQAALQRQQQFRAQQQQAVASLVIQTISNSPMPPAGGWQTTYPTQERFHRAMNLVTSMALGMQTLDLRKACEYFLNWERQCFLKAPSKEAYENDMTQKGEEFIRKRQANESNLRNTMSAQQAAAQAQVAQAQAQAQQLIMNQNGMMGMGRGMAPNQGPGQPPQPGFQPMQHPMQQSPIPQSQMPMGMNMGPMNPGMNAGLGGPGNQPMGQNPQMMAAMMANRQQPPGPAMAIAPQDRMRLQNRIREIVDALTEPQKKAIRDRYGPNLPANMRERDPIVFYAQSRAMQEFKDRANAPQMNMGGVNPAQAAMLQRQMSQGSMNAGPHLMGGNNFANVESLVNQQKAGMMAQEAGQMVVPASNPQGRNPTPQTMGGQGGNLGHPAQHQPGQRPIGPQGGANQAQMHAHAQGKHMAPAQAGGVPGTMGPARSPGQALTNMAPGDGNPMEEAHGMVQGPGPFNAGLNPRFSQANNQRPPAQSVLGNPALRNAFLATLTPDKQQAFLKLDPARQAEVLIKAQEGRMLRMNQMGMGMRPDGSMMGRPGPGMHVPGAMMAQPNMMTAANNGQPQIPQLEPTMAAMDSLEVRPEILGQLKAPLDIKNWGELKQWCSQHPVLSQNMPKVLAHQKNHYLVLQKRNMQLAQGQQVMGPGLVNARGGAMGPRPQGGMPLGMGNEQMPITETDIANLRKMDPGRFNAMTDDEVRLYAAKIRAAGQRGIPMQRPHPLPTPQQHQQQQQQQPQHQFQPPPQPQPAQSAAGSPPGQGLGPQGAGPAAKKAHAANAAAQKKAAAAAAAAQANRQQGSAPTPAQGQKSLKRPFPDDSTESPAQKTGAPPRPASQQGQGQGTPALSNNQQLQMMKNQQQLAMINRAQMTAKLRALTTEARRIVEEERRSELQLSAEQRQASVPNGLPQLGREVTKAAKVFFQWYSVHQDDQTALQFLQTKYRLMSQFEDPEYTRPKNTRMMTLADVQRGFAALKKIHDDLNAQAAQVQAQAQAQSQAPAATTQVPLNAANLEAQTAALSKSQQQQQPQPQPQPQHQHQRKGSKSVAAQQVQAAAESTAPAPQQGPQVGVTSPQGLPNYMSKAKDMNLHIPPKKKAKTSNQAQKGQKKSPQVTKTQAPEPKRQASMASAPTPAPAPAPAPPKPLFYCSQADCEFATTGFPTEEARQAHVQVEHIEPLENPIKFFQEHLAGALQLDLDGNPLNEAGTGTATQATQETPQPAAAAMSTSQSRQGQTPASFAPTPMSRGMSMNRSASGTGPRPGPAAGPARPDAARTPAQRSTAGKTPADSSKVTPSSSSPESAAVPAPAAAADPFADCINPQTLFANIPGMDPVASGVFADPAVYLALSPPSHGGPGASSSDTTPASSKDGATSEPEVPGGGPADPWQMMDDGYMMNLQSFSVESLQGVEVGEDEKALLADAIDGVVAPGADICWDDVQIDFSKPPVFEEHLYSMDPT